MTDPERQETTFGRDHARRHGAGDRHFPHQPAAAAMYSAASSTQPAPERIRRAGERLLLLAEADGAVSEGGVPDA